MGANFDFRIKKHFAFHFSCVAKVLQNHVRGGVAGQAGLALARSAGPANKTNDPLKSGPVNKTNDPLKSGLAKKTNDLLKSGPALRSQSASTPMCLLTTHAYRTCSC